MSLRDLKFLKAELLAAGRQAEKTSNLSELLLACTLIPVKLTLTASGEVTYTANHFQERLAAMCSTYRAELSEFLGRLPDGQWDSMKHTPEGTPMKKK